MKNKKGAFTLVELIVVITILAILGTIGFIAMQNYNVYARDTTRKTEIGMISRAIKIKEVQGGYAPKPANAVEITASGTLIGWQGEFTSKIGSKYGLSGKFQDPLDGQNYVYSVDKNLNKFTIGGFLESDEVALNKKILGNTYAKEGRKLTTKGDKFGIILKDGEVIKTNIDIMSGSLDSSYDLYLDDNEKLTGTGLVSMNPKASCKRILELGNVKRGDKKDGVYTINPTGDNPFEVYCDMTTNGGGWTLTAKFSNQDDKHWVSTKNVWKNNTFFGNTTTLKKGNDAKSKAWSIVTSNNIMWSDTKNIGKYMYTNDNCLGGTSLSLFFDSWINSYPDTSNLNYKKKCTIIKTYNGTPSWMAEPDRSNKNINSPDLGPNNGYILFGNTDGSDTSAVISGYKEGFSEADVGLGSNEDVGFGTNTHAQDIGGPTSCGYNDIQCKNEYSETVFMWVK